MRFTYFQKNMELFVLSISVIYVYNVKAVRCSVSYFRKNCFHFQIVMWFCFILFKSKILSCDLAILWRVGLNLLLFGTPYFLESHRVSFARRSPSQFFFLFSQKDSKVHRHRQLLSTCFPTTRFGYVWSFSPPNPIWM